MAVDTAPSGKAPPGRLRLGASTRALAAVYSVAACGSRPHNNAVPYGYHATRTSEERLT